MSRTIQIFVLCLVAISCAQDQNAPACNPCCSNPTPSQPPPCQNTAAPPTPTPEPTPTPCPYATSQLTNNPATSQPTNNPASSQPTNNPGQPTNTNNPSSGTPIARQPDPNPAGWPQTMPNYMLVPGYPGMPNMPSIPGYPGMPNMPSFPPYPFLGNYMPIVQDPTTGQRYLVMQNPFLPTNKYSQILNIYSPEMNPGYYAVPPANNATSIEPAKQSDKS